MALISTLRDDFEDGVIDAGLWTITGTVSESSGRAIITPNAVSVLSAIRSNAFYDLSANSITAQIPVATNDGSSGTLQCALAVMIDDNNIIALRKIGSELVASYTVAGTPTDVFAAVYSSSAHAYWRIRADASNIYWETSANGTGTFTIQSTQNLSAVFSIASVRVYLYAYYSSVEAAPGSLQVASINPSSELTFSGESSSSGSLRLRRVLVLTASAASTSDGSLSLVISPAGIPQLAFSGASTSTGQFSLIITAANNLLFAGLSTSSGTLRLVSSQSLTFFGQSFSTAQFSFQIIPLPIDPLLIQYFTFEPPIIYDRPAVHSKTPRSVRQYQYYSGHSPGATGVSVLKINGQFQTIYTPSVDQIASAECVYQGGHIYTIPQSDADALVAAGYMVTALPVPVPLMTVYPLESLYPSEDLFPGYHDTVLVS